MSVSPDSNRTPYPNMLNNPFPNINQPRGAADGLLTYAGRSFNFVNTKFRTPHVDLFSFSIQRAIGERSRFEITYSGSRGYDQQSTKPYNEQDDGTFRDGCNWMLGGNPSYCDAAIPNPWRNQDAFFGTTWYTAGYAFAQRAPAPLPAVQHVHRVHAQRRAQLVQLAAGAVHHAHAQRHQPERELHVREEHGAHAGILDASNDIMQQGITQYDRPHRFVASVISQMPFGKGKRWLNHYDGFVGRLVSGWENTVIFNVMSGMPWTLPDSPKAMYLKDAAFPSIGTRRRCAPSSRACSAGTRTTPSSPCPSAWTTAARNRTG